MKVTDLEAGGNFYRHQNQEKAMASIECLTVQDVAKIKARLVRGDFQHRIAADYDLNQGRISEIKTGKRFVEVPPAKEIKDGE